MPHSTVASRIVLTFCASLCCAVAALVTAQVRNQPSSTSAPPPPAPGQTVRQVPPGWRVAGSPSGNPRQLYLEYLAAYNRYNHALSQGPPDAPAAMQALQEFRAAETKYYTEGLGLERIPSSSSSSTASGGSSASGSNQSSQSTQAPPLQTVQILETVEISQIGYLDFSQDLQHSETGDPAQLTTVRVVVHGRVTDSVGSPIDGASVLLSPSGHLVNTNSNGEFSIVFPHPGFSDVDIAVNAVLEARCLVVEPRVASFGAVTLGTGLEKDVFLENTCPRQSVDVSFSAGSPPYTLRVVDCTAGQGEGVIWATGNTTMIMGPGSRCKLKLGFNPASYGFKEARLPITGSDQPKVPIRLYSLGTVSDMYALGQSEVHIPGVVPRGSTKSHVFTLSNLRDDVPLTITGLQVVGLAASEYDAEIAMAPNLPPPLPGAPAQGKVVSTQLPPAGSCMIGIDFTPSRAGVRNAFLIVRTSDPDAPEIRLPLSGLGS